jgi:hypothetical protein
MQAGDKKRLMRGKEESREGESLAPETLSFFVVFYIFLNKSNKRT